MNTLFYTLPGGLQAEFTENEDKTLTLTRWPRWKHRHEIQDIVPSEIEGKNVTRIAPLAFAPFHMSEEDFKNCFISPYSFNMMLVMNGGRLTYEGTAQNEKTAAEIVLPDTIVEIGGYAFWHCAGLKKLRIPDGVKHIPAGCFGECTDLEELRLPAHLTTIGLYDPATASIPSPMLLGMPDVGAFYACHALNELTLPSTVRIIGPMSFNSCGICHLIRKGTAEPENCLIADNAFDHAPALLWMDRIRHDTDTGYRIGLPAARDKILTSDKKFGRLSHIPGNFFQKGPEYFDRLAQEVFRLDFAARMALGRLQRPEGLRRTDRSWYKKLLIDYFDQAPAFMPPVLPGDEDTDEKADPYERLFTLLWENGLLEAQDVSDLIRAAGEAHLSIGLIDRMMEIRIRNFSTATGFEDLDI